MLADVPVADCAEWLGFDAPLTGFCVSLVNGTLPDTPLPKPVELLLACHPLPVWLAEVLDVFDGLLDCLAG